MTVLILILLFFTKTCYGRTDVNCILNNRPEEEKMVEKILEKIGVVKMLSLKEPSANETHPIIVSIQFILVSFKYDSRESKFSAYIWANTSWIDRDICWDPGQYLGIDSTAVNNYHIWSPKIKLSNSINDELDERWSVIPCEVTSKGKVHCVGQSHYESICIPDLSNWPYDVQKCQLFLATWPNWKKTVKLDFAPRAMKMLSSDYGTEWEIMGYEQEEDQGSVNKQLVMTFTLQRHSKVLGVIVIVPCVILTVLSLSSLALDVRTNLRTSVLCFSLLCHYDYLSKLGYHVPAHNWTTPFIITYFKGSLILTIISLILTYFLNITCKLDRKIPDFVLKINDKVFSSFGRFLVWPEWRFDKQSSKEFVSFCNVVNSVWIFVTVMTYSIMFVVCVPKHVKLAKTIPPEDYYYNSPPS